MSTVASTTLIALAVITAATFAICFHVIDETVWEWAIGVAGAGTGVLHLSQFTNGTVGLSSSSGSAAGKQGAPGTG